eukprot:TRINITY_DN1903_c0_g4_i1.p1 TRINITY_DN1903_c0_g4~~TRINITY_DN1903_c0_g4_i1.p1  ORF type:complete len:108 (-),score=35.85 TRINITY_DN1903_c0_g4_i1:100-423(-)
MPNVSRMVSMMSSLVSLSGENRMVSKRASYIRVMVTLLAPPLVRARLSVPSPTAAVSVRELTTWDRLDEGDVVLAAEEDVVEGAEEEEEEEFEEEEFEEERSERAHV